MSNTSQSNAGRSNQITPVNIDLESHMPEADNATPLPADKLVHERWFDFRKSHYINKIHNENKILCHKNIDEFMNSTENNIHTLYKGKKCFTSILIYTILSI